MTISLDEAQRIGEQVEKAIHEGRELLKDMKRERQALEETIRQARQAETIVAGYVTAFTAKMDEIFDYTAAVIIDKGNARVAAWLKEEVANVTIAVEKAALAALQKSLQNGLSPNADLVLRVAPPPGQPR